MAINVVGTAVGSRSGSGSFTITPPVGATSYLALILCPHANLTAPSGWTFMGEYAVDSAGDTGTLYKGASGAGSSWSTTVGTLLSDYPVVGVVAGYDVALPGTLVPRVYEEVNDADTPYLPGQGVHGGPGITAQFVATVSDTSGTLAYPPVYPSSRNTTKATTPTAGLTGYVAVAHQSHTDTGFTGEAVWTVPSASWDASTISIHIPDPSATEETYSLPAGDQWAGGPTTSVSTASSSQLSGTVVTPDDARLKYVGAKAVYNIGSGWYRPQELTDNNTVDLLPPYAVKFTTDAQLFEVNFRQRNDLPAGPDPAGAMKGMTVRLKVDGQWVTHRQTYLGNSNTGYPPAITTPTNYNASTAGWFLVDFGSAGTRTVEVWMMSEFAGIKIPTANTLTAPPLPKFTMLVLGDSLFSNDQYGTGDYTSAGASVAGTYTSMTGPFSYTAQTLGFDNFVNSASGGGAYSITYEAQKWDNTTVVTRDVQAHDPQLILIGTGVNDYALQGSPNDTTIGNAAADLYTKVKAACPNALIIVVGAPETTGFISDYFAGMTARANGVYKARAATAGLPFFDPKAGVLYDGSGSAIYSPGTGWYHTSWEGWDGIHPSAQGSEDMGNAFADVFAQMLPASDVLNTMRWGDSTASKYYWGDAPVDAIYWGDTKVYG